MAAGEFVAIADSVGDTNTTDQLNMFEAYQKMFIVNGAILKVTDRINTKLTSNEAIVANLPKHGDIIRQEQGGTAVASMVVDFISEYDTTEANKHLIYGKAYYAGAATEFDTDNDIIDADDAVVIDGGADLTVAAGAPPHWYNWTVYNGDTDTYGTMPDKAYLGCLYCGRPTISGNPEHPDQWYMARQNDPWDFAYSAGDARTPVMGGNADAGEMGEIVRCLIPYKDDRLIYGCATCIWYMEGDPGYGGALFALDLTTGMFGAKSYCWDGAGNLYFWGTNGFYRTTIPGTPMCLSAIALPDLIKDENANPTTHRITMAYDRRDCGIHICITKQSDGTNSNWWYDLRTEGLFHEEYPHQCGAYSLFYYDANDPTYRDVLIGCKDGYLRKFDKTSKSDILSDDSERLIDSYVVFGPMQLADGFSDGVLNNINIISAGGEANGSESDSDDIDYLVFTARSAEHVIEDTKADPQTPKLSGVFNSPGYRKGNIDRRGTRGRFGAIKIGNNTVGESWGLEKLTLSVGQKGKVL